MIQPTSGPYAISGPTITTESDPYLACTLYTIDPFAQTVTATLKMGTGTQSAGKETAFTPGPQAPSVMSITFNANTAAWSASAGSYTQSGTLNASAISVVQAVIAAVVTGAKNSVEAFVAANLTPYAGTVYTK